MPQKIAIMGAGAVGCWFGAMLAKAGNEVTLIGRGARLEALSRDRLFFDSVRGPERIALPATADPAAASGAAFVLLTVKTTDTEVAARELAPHLSPEALLVSMQNGVDNAARIRGATGVVAASAAVYVAVQMLEPGHLRHSARGDVILGGVLDSRPQHLAQLFNDAAIPTQIAADIRETLWAKMFNNCAYNAISALSASQYGPMLENPEIRHLMRAAVEEAVAVARAEGVAVTGDPVEAAYALGRSMPAAMSSTAQDLARHRPTEIASLNGYVARRASELGVQTPVNATLAALVAMREIVLG